MDHELFKELSQLETVRDMCSDILHSARYAVHYHETWENTGENEHKEAARHHFNLLIEHVLTVEAWQPFEGAGNIKALLYTIANDIADTLKEDKPFPNSKRPLFL